MEKTEHRTLWPKKGGGKEEYDLEISTNICEMQMEQYKHRQHVSYYLILSLS